MTTARPFTPATPRGFHRASPTPVNFEVYHHPLKDDNDKTDLWVFDDLGTGKSLTNQAYPRVLHASKQLTGAGNKFLYTCVPNNTDHSEEFSIEPVDAPNEFTFSGNLKLENTARTSARRTGTTSRHRVAGASIRSPAGRSVLLLIDEMPSFLSGLEHGIATGVVDDKYLLLVAASRMS